MVIVPAIRNALTQRPPILLLGFRLISHRFYTMDLSGPTLAIYQRDETRHEHTTSVTAIEPVSALSEADRLLFKHSTIDDHVVTTAETIFYAQGGGQPCDTGIMQSVVTSNNNNIILFRVSSVRNGLNGRILHLGRFESADGSSTFNPGHTVKQAIDREKRKLNSRIHTGGHLVGLAVRHFHDLIPNVTELKAQHYPELAFVDFQGTIDSKHKEAIEAKANEFVSQALPVKVYWWDEKELREKCAVVPAAVAIPEGQLTRAVDIVGAGAYPCGGTHVPDTSQVGKLVVKKISRSKGNSKISYSISD